MSDVVAIFTIVGGTASVVMAIAAVVALSTWRKQIKGASHHELAKKLSAALRQVAIARHGTLLDLRRFKPDRDTMAPSLLALAMHTLAEDAEQLDKAATELRALEGQVAVQWGDTMQQLVEVIAVESALLATVAEAELRDPAARAAVGFLYTTTKPIAPTVTGVAFEKALDEYTALAQEWLGLHVGREGAKAISTDELSARKKRVDAEVERRAADERAVFAKKEAEREQAMLDKIVAAGGPEAYLEQMTRTVTPADVEEAARALERECGTSK